MFLRHLVHWPYVDFQVKFYGDRPRGTPASGPLNVRGVAKYSDLDLSKTISRKRCKRGGKLLLMTNRKSHMSFRLVPKSLTLNDLERRNSPNLCVISPNSVAFGTDYVKVVGDTPIHFAAETYVGQGIKFLVIYHLGPTAILAGDNP